MPRLPALLLLALLAAPPLAAGASDGPDFVVTLQPGLPPVYEGPAGLADLVEERRGDRYAWNLTLTNELTVGEFRVRGGFFDVERVEQVTPILEGVPDDRYPLFVQYPDDRLWEAEGAAQVYRYNGTPDDFVLRLAFPGPDEVTLVLSRDVTPPQFSLGPITDVTPIGFLQETRTDEPALANLRIRPAAGGEWVENPTPSFHFLQRFPIQGLDADTEYVAQVVFTDFGGNEEASPAYPVRTAPAPARPLPIVTDLEPASNVTLPDGNVVFRARVSSPESPLTGGSVRFFLDKREVNQDLVLLDGVFEYRPPPLAPGHHSASLEVTNAAGGRSVVRWSFDVAGAEQRAPGPAPLLLVGLVLVTALVLRRRG